MTNKVYSSQIQPLYKRNHIVYMLINRETPMFPIPHFREVMTQTRCNNAALS